MAMVSCYYIRFILGCSNGLNIRDKNTFFQKQLCSQRLQDGTLTIPRLSPRSSSGKSRDSISLDCLIVCLPVPKSSQRLAWDTCRSWITTETNTRGYCTHTGWGRGDRGQGVCTLVTRVLLVKVTLRLGDKNILFGAFTSISSVGLEKWWRTWKRGRAQLWAETWDQWSVDVVRE